MKQLILCYFLLVSPVAFAQTDWEWLNPEPSGLPGQDMYFFDEQLGFLVNSSQILRTQDGGVSWSVITDVVGGYKIAFIDSIGYIVGYHGNVYSTSDRGETWKEILFDFPRSLNSLTLISQDSVFITGDDQLFITYNGGTTWITRPVEYTNSLGYGVNIEDAYFTSAAVGHAVCTHGTILKTTDSGLTWYVTESSNVAPSNFFDVTFVNENVGFASQEHSELYQTTDGGETWVDLGSTIDAAYDMHFFNENVGFIAGDHGAIHKTTDGGKTWDWIGFDGRRYYNDIYTVHFVNENLGFAAGARGQIIKTADGGESWTPYAMSYLDVADIQRVDQSLFVMGESIYRSDDGGQQWTDIAPAMPQDYAEGNDYYKAGHFFSSSQAIVVAAGRNDYGFDALLKTIDGGQNWKELDIFLHFQQADALFFLNDSVGFISTSDAAYFDGIYKTTDQGESWQWLSDLKWCSQLYFLDEQHGFALRYGDLYQSQDGGVTWELTYEDYTHLNQLYFVNDTLGYIAADHGVVLKTTDTGGTWTELSTDYDHLQSISFYNEWVGFATTNSSHLYRTLNGGEDWERIQTPAPVNTLIIDSTRTILAGGDYGRLLKAKLLATELVNINQIAVGQITDSSAMLSSHIQSSLSTTQVWVEYGTEPGVYTQRVPLHLLEGYQDDTLSFTIQPLEDSTRYYSRFIIDLGDTIDASPEISFQTKYRPMVEDPVTALHPSAGDDAPVFVYPNAFNDALFVSTDLPANTVMFYLYSLSGSVVYAVEPHQVTATAEGLRISTHWVPAGTYLLQMIGRQNTESFRVIRRE